MSIFEKVRKMVGIEPAKGTEEVKEAPEQREDPRKDLRLVFRFIPTVSYFTTVDIVCDDLSGKEAVVKCLGDKIQRTSGVLAEIGFSKDDVKSFKLMKIKNGIDYSKVPLPTRGKGRRSFQRKENYDRRALRRTLRRKFFG